MRLSQFGEKLTCKAGILSLMDDLGNCMGEGGGKMIMMGGGNPGYVHDFQEILRNRLLEISSDSTQFRELVGIYSPPQGEKTFITALARLLHDKLGWPVGPENICLTNGSQTAFFMLLNLFAGPCTDGTQQKICLPLAPEYIGYADLGVSDNLFTATRPKIELLADGLFKYRVDFDSLRVDSGIGAVCVSRPTNPTGNVITDDELLQLCKLAAKNDIPLIVDNAYGLPFPGIVFCEANLVWNEQMIVCLSLSKLGLPAVRTGIIVAKPEVIEALSAVNAIMSLAPGSFGAILARKMVESGEIIGLSRSVLLPFYRQKMEKALTNVRKHFAGLPCRTHKPEGAFFLWLWFEGLPITSLELYRRLKKRGVLIVSGHYFFPGLREPWQHGNECIRITYSQDDEDVERGLALIADEVRKAYAENK